MEEKAREKLGELAEAYLTMVNPRTGRTSQKRIYLTVGEQVFDQHGRLLTYGAPEEKDPKKRITFNLLLLQHGMAVSYPIFPNIPKPEDLKLVQEAVRKARGQKLGIWAEEDTLLLPYEYRFCVDTLRGKRRGSDKDCVDLTTGLIHQPQEYYTIRRRIGSSSMRRTWPGLSSA